MVDTTTKKKTKTVTFFNKPNCGFDISKQIHGNTR